MLLSNGKKVGFNWSTCQIIQNGMSWVENSNLLTHFGLIYLVRQFDGSISCSYNLLFLKFLKRKYKSCKLLYNITKSRNYTIFYIYVRRSKT